MNYFTLHMAVVLTGKSMMGVTVGNLEQATPFHNLTICRDNGVVCNHYFLSIDFRIA